MSFEHPTAPAPLTYKGRPIRLAGCDCNECGAEFFVKDAPEHQPVMCPYCGIKFIRYREDDGDGEMHDMSGRKIWE